MIKIVGEKKYGELLGGHIVGAKATELIQELVNAKLLEGGYPRDRPHHPRPSDAVGGGDGGGPRRRRLADPRLSGCAAWRRRRPRTQPTFYYDLGSPACYLLAERVMSELAVVPEWEPVLGADLGVVEPEPDRGSDRARGRRARDPAAALAARAGRPKRGRRCWPRPTPSTSAAPWRSRWRAFARSSPADATSATTSTVLIAAAACEMHPTAVLKGIGLRSVTDGLERASARAAARRRARAARDPGRRRRCSTRVEDAAARAGGAAEALP